MSAWWYFTEIALINTILVLVAQVAAIKKRLNTRTAAYLSSTVLCNVVPLSTMAQGMEFKLNEISLIIYGFSVGSQRCFP
jgi:hypothetical protein